MDGADALLLSFLDAQRARVLAVIDGLTEEQLRRPAVPSGWTVLGLVEHLGHAERHWFQQVAVNQAAPLPWPPDPAQPDASDDPDDDDQPEVADPPFVSDYPVEEVLAFYRDCVTAGQQLTASTPLDTIPQGDHGQGASADVTSLRYIVLHMIEETARHLGHLDIARELLDGRTGLGPDPL